jgi:hypothetical protein
MKLEIPRGNWWDWDIVLCDATRLRLGANYDLSYAHGLEVVFSDPVYLSCPTVFQEPEFREPTPTEIQRITEWCGATPPVIVAFEAGGGGRTPVTCLIAAETVKVVEGVVYRYPRPDLQPGERLAPWVLEPPDA